MVAGRGQSPRFGGKSPFPVSAPLARRRHHSILAASAKHGLRQRPSPAIPRCNLLEDSSSDEALQLFMRLLLLLRSVTRKLNGPPGLIVSKLLRLRLFLQSLSLSLYSVTRSIHSGSGVLFPVTKSLLIFMAHNLRSWRVDEKNTEPESGCFERLSTTCLQLRRSTLHQSANNAASFGVGIAFPTTTNLLRSTSRRLLFRTTEEVMFFHYRRVARLLVLTPPLITRRGVDTKSLPLRSHLQFMLLPAKSRSDQMMEAVAVIERKPSQTLENNMGLLPSKPMRLLFLHKMGLEPIKILPYYLSLHGPVDSGRIYTFNLGPKPIKSSFI